jgi:hypothetical protein
MLSISHDLKHKLAQARKKVTRAMNIGEKPVADSELKLFDSVADAIEQLERKIEAVERKAKTRRV